MRQSPSGMVPPIAGADGITAQPGSASITSFKFFSWVMGAVAILAGGLVLLGWALNIAVFKSVIPGLFSMKANTAFTFILAGASLLLLREEPAKPERRRYPYRIGQVCAFMVFLLGLLTLAEYLFDWNPGIDQWLFAEPAGSIGALSPGRMAPNTALNFIMIGFALLFLDAETRKGYRLAQILALAAALTAMLAFVGYIYRDTPLYGIAYYTQMALYTSLVFLLLCAGILSARPERGLMAVVVSRSAGGLIIRRLLPAVIVLPIVLGWLRLEGERAGYFGTTFGLALFALSNVVVLTALVGWNARLLHRLDTTRERAQAALRASQIMFQRFFEMAPDAIVAVNREGSIMRVNSRAEKMFGYSREELQGRPVEILIPERFMPRHAEHRRGYISAPRARPMGTGLELYARRRDGSEFPADITLGPLETDEGLVVLSTVRDVTERKRIEDALAQQAKELARSNAELERFAYVASHDLQEPLRMVASYTQLLARHYQGKLGSDADEFIAYAVDGASRMQQLINDLLAYSRVGTRGKEFAPTDCESVLKQALSNLQAAIEESHAVVTHDPLPRVMADALQLGQLFQNLIGNAIKFHGAPPRIHVSAEKKQNPGQAVPGEWVFSFRDNGIGIAPEYFDRIFIIFQRLHSLAEYPGTGIGLALCKRIVERHGGRIWVESRVGEGSTFYFTIPEREGRPEAVDA